MADAKSIVDKLYRAFNDPGFLGLGGTDEEGVFEALRMAKDQGIMRDVDALYAKTYPGELNLKDELDDELSGDDFDKAMAYYNEGMRTPAKALGSGPGGTTSGTQSPARPVHGTLVPGSPDSVFVELLGADRKPVPEAKCRFAGNPGRIYTADGKGIVELPIHAGASRIDIEWEEKDAAPDEGPDLPRFYWKKTVQLKVTGNDASALSGELSNLSFDGTDLGQQVRSYQSFYDQSETGNINDIRTELAQRIKTREEGGTPNA